MCAWKHYHNKKGEFIFLIIAQETFQAITRTDRPTAAQHADTERETESKSGREQQFPSQAASLSEHATDEVSQGVERAVITGRLEGRPFAQTARRGVGHT